MRIYTVLDASLPGGEYVRLWVVAPGKQRARALLSERDIWWREETFSGPVRPGGFIDSMERNGLMREEGVYAYSMPWLPDTPVMQVVSRSKSVRRATMGDIFPRA